VCFDVRFDVRFDVHFDLYFDVRVDVRLTANVFEWVVVFKNYAKISPKLLKF